MNQYNLSLMNKDELKKLQSQINKMLQKENAKSVKPKKGFNHDDLFNDDIFTDNVVNDPFEKTMRKVYKTNTKIYDTNKKIYDTNKKITEKYNALNKVEEDDSDDGENIIEYPKIKVSLRKFRLEEARRTNTVRKKNSSFLKLFGKRLDSMEGEQKKVSNTLYVDIKHADDHDDVNVQEKIYGPFMTDMPKLSNNDMYKFMMYILLNNNFSILSIEVINKIGCKIITYDNQQFMDHRMGKLKLQSYLLCKQKPIKSHGKNTCVVDYVWDQVKGKRGFKTYDYDKLKSEIYSYVYDPPMINTEELID